MRADLATDTAYGQCVTVACEDDDVPLCSIFGPAFDDNEHAQTSAHEMGHAFQYALMGSYLDSLASWAWWMEGTASWIENFYAEDPRVWSRVGQYVANPQWGLHSDFSDLFAGVRGDHMYGTAVLAYFLEQEYGGPDTVRATWEWGAEHSGEKIFFRDAIEGIGLSFDEVWPHYLATLSVLDLEGGENVEAIPGHMVINALPGEGAPPAASLPEGLGFGVVHLPATLGMAGMDLRVELDAEAAVPWHAVLARTDGVTPGSAVLDYAVATWDDAGHGEVVLTGFDGSADAFLVVSPESIEKHPFGYSLRAELVPAGAADGSTSSDASTTDGGATATGSDDGGSETTTAPASEGAAGCSCSSAHGAGGAAWCVPVVAVWARRRRSASAASRPSRCAR
ncbi:MAG: hypothetical protein IPN32_13660 [Deltaproteobacteria bacterium]|nr:hypothetical protein [Deltaproteobacteria bacterium]